MELAWGEDFTALAEVSKSVFARYSPLEDRSNNVLFADQVSQFAELGWLQLGDANGTDEDGATLGTIAAVFVEMGRALAETPLLDLTVARDAATLVGTATATELASRIGDGEASSSRPSSPGTGDQRSPSTAERRAVECWESASRTGRTASWCTPST